LIGFRRKHPRTIPTVSAEWVPFTVRNNPDSAEEYQVLREGVPEWLRSTIIRWVTRYFRSGDAIEHLNDLGRRLHISIPWQSGYQHESSSIRATLLELEAAGRLLDVLDFVASRSLPYDISKLNAWNRALADACSAYELIRSVEDGVPRVELRRRIDETATKSLIAATTHGRAGEHLGRAWSAAYGRTPDRSKAYREAVRAVEAAAKPLITPDDSVATLGKMNKAMRSKPEKWQFLGAPDGAMDTVITMAELLWTGQIDRHGTSDPEAPLDVTQEQAEAAVHLAATLVQWFSSGSIQRTA